MKKILISFSLLINCVFCNASQHSLFKGKTVAATIAAGSVVGALAYRYIGNNFKAQAKLRQNAETLAPKLEKRKNSLEKAHQIICQIKSEYENAVDAKENRRELIDKLKQVVTTINTTSESKMIPSSLIPKRYDNYFLIEDEIKAIEKHDEINCGCDGPQYFENSKRRNFCSIMSRAIDQMCTEYWLKIRDANVAHSRNQKILDELPSVIQLTEKQIKAKKMERTFVCSLLASLGLSAWFALT